MRKCLLSSLLLCTMLLCSSCHSWPANRRGGLPIGAIGFASPEHQEMDLGFVRLHGKHNIYRQGMSFQFPSFGIYGGNDHTSVGLLFGFTYYYYKKEMPVVDDLEGFEQQR